MYDLDDCFNEALEESKECYDKGRACSDNFTINKRGMWKLNSQFPRWSHKTADNQFHSAEAVEVECHSLYASFNIII